jgi:hypothetical protein
MLWREDEHVARQDVRFQRNRKANKSHGEAPSGMALIWMLDRCACVVHDQATRAYGQLLSSIEGSCFSPRTTCAALYSVL